MQSNVEDSDKKTNVSKYFTRTSNSGHSTPCDKERANSSKVHALDSVEVVTNTDKSGDVEPAEHMLCAGQPSNANRNSQDLTDDEQTEEYLLTAADEAERTQSPVRYSQGDFESCDGSGLESDEAGGLEERNSMGKSASKRKKSRHEDISDNSSDDNMETPWKEVKPKQKKYVQTTLNFGGGAARAEGAGSSRPVTRKAVQKKLTDSKSFYRQRGDRDTENYRLGYPGQRDNPRLNANLEFYTGKISSFPDGAFIDEIHNDWWGNFGLLEGHHGYIQWIFPIREEGMNIQAQSLQLHEAKEIMADKLAHNRVLLSYEMMLDFYGMKLLDAHTGELQRSKRWQKRYENLNYSGHNYLRITRILKSLGEFGYERLKKPFLQFILQEIFEHRQLRRTLSSLQNYWIGTIKSNEDREELYQFIEQHTG